MQEISVTELAAYRRNATPHFLLDVREADELQTAAIAGAHHIPMKTIAARLGEIPHDQPVIVMCHHGGRSTRVTQELERNGYTNAVNLTGGIHAWACEIDPTIARY